MSILQDYPALLALVIFCTRVIDVSMGTVRTIMVIRGYRATASLVAFVEVLLWILAVSQVLENLDRWYLAFAYAGGFATGNFVGMWIESKLALGSELVRTISRNTDIELAHQLRAGGFQVTELPGRTGETPVEVLLVVERRRRIPELLGLIHREDPDAVCTVSDVRQAAPSRPRAAGKRK